MSASMFVSCCVVVILASVPAVSADCMDTAMRCVDIATNASTAIAAALMASDSQQVATLCSSTRQDLTACVDLGRQECGNNAMAASLDNLLPGLNVTCGTDVQCQTQANACYATVLAIMSSEPSASGMDSATLQQLCQAYPQVQTCIAGLSAECRALPLVVNMTSSIATASSGCAVITGGGTCSAALPCFMDLTSAPTDCRSLPALITCLQRQTSSCNVDQSQITFDQVESLSTDLCSDASNYPAEYQNCSALNQCVLTSPELGLSSDEDPDPQVLLSAFTRLTEPSFLCRMIEVGTGCYVSEAANCNYEAGFVTAMTSRHQTLQRSCPSTGTGNGGSGTGGGTGGTGGLLPQMLTLYLLVLVAVWTK